MVEMKDVSMVYQSSQTEALWDLPVPEKRPSQSF